MNITIIDKDTNKKLGTVTLESLASVQKTLPKDIDKYNYCTDEQLKAIESNYKETHSVVESTGATAKTKSNKIGMITGGLLFLVLTIGLVMAVISGSDKTEFANLNFGTYEGYDILNLLDNPKVVREDNVVYVTGTANNAALGKRNIKFVYNIEVEDGFENFYLHEAYMSGIEMPEILLLTFFDVVEDLAKERGFK